MADGQYRFHQPGAGQFHYQQHNYRNVNRAASPQGGRRTYTTDTPSPSRSPVTSSPAHNTFNMYNHSGHQGQHVMMNGGQNHQRFGIPLPNNNNYHKNGHHAHGHQSNHHHNQHHNNMGHQYNHSSGGVSNTAAHYAQGHVQNGLSENMQDEMEDSLSEYWQEQREKALESRQASSPHHYARAIAQQAKGINFITAHAALTDEQPEDRGRARPVQKSNRQDWNSLDFGGQGLRALSNALFRYEFLEKLFLCHNKLDHLPSAVGRLKSLVHLDVSHNHLSYLPEEIGMLTNLQKLLAFDNNITELPSQMGYMYSLDFLGIEGNDHMAPVYKEHLAQEGTKKLIEWLRESMEEPEPPNMRSWIVLDETTSNSNQPDTFKALTYNILCDKYATRQQYGYAPSAVLDWENRKNIILEEVRHSEADIVCLQELDKFSYDEFFRPELSRSGYKAYHAQKARSETLGADSKFVDGCGTFWKEKKYVLLDTRHLIFGRVAVGRDRPKASADMLNRVWQRDDIAIVTFLENRVTGSRIIVVNAHIFWDPAYKDVKLIQVAVLLEELSKVAGEWSRHPPCTNKAVFRFSDAEDHDEPTPEFAPSQEYKSGVQIPMIICGDFNSSADSAVYDLLAHGDLGKAHSDLEDRNYGNFSEGISHPFTLKSSYGAIGELDFTNYTPGYTDVIDYIWYSSNALRVTGLLDGVDKDYLQKVPGFPTFHFPSDHLALKAEFSVTGKKGGKVVEADFGPQRERK